MREKQGWDRKLVKSALLLNAILYCILELARRNALCWHDATANGDV